MEQIVFDCNGFQNERAYGFRRKKMQSRNTANQDGQWTWSEQGDFTNLYFMYNIFSRKRVMFHFELVH